ncbi:MAG: hypothetical protein AB1489_41500 [Acidobacteriota bacterium]
MTTTAMIKPVRSQSYWVDTLTVVLALALVQLWGRRLPSKLVGGFGDSHGLRQL